MKIRTYSELIQYSSFEDRFNYLKLLGEVGRETFGFNRHINQRFYRSAEWKHIRAGVIIRDNGCNLGIKDLEIYDNILIHHMNVITVDDIINHSPYVFDPEFLICTDLDTHNPIHYGSSAPKQTTVLKRKRGDTCPWKTF